MKQRHMPLGYRMAEGKIVIDPETAEIINRIFQEYSEGAYLYQLARKLTEQGALNANHKPVWNHGTVGKILENRKYLGDEFYPTMIEPELFTKVQERRIEKSRELMTFIPLGWAPWDVLVMVSGLVSLLVLLGLLVFARRQLFSEFGKQFSA